MLRYAEPLPPASSFAHTDLDEFLSEAIALAERINCRLSERSAVSPGDSVSAPSQPVEN